jgi:hypothetical protein
MRTPDGPAQGTLTHWGLRGLTTRPRPHPPPLHNAFRPHETARPAPEPLPSYYHRPPCSLRPPALPTPPVRARPASGARSVTACGADRSLCRRRGGSLMQTLSAGRQAFPWLATGRSGWPVHAGSSDAAGRGSQDAPAGWLPGARSCSAGRCRPLARPAGGWLAGQPPIPAAAHSRRLGTILRHGRGGRQQHRRWPVRRDGPREEPPFGTPCWWCLAVRTSPRIGHSEPRI